MSQDQVFTSLTAPPPVQIPSASSVNEEDQPAPKRQKKSPTTPKEPKEPKVKKPYVMTEARKEAFAKAQAKRRENIAMRKAEKENARQPVS